jgi:S-adenosylmethionine-dependent methyltransferase
VADLNQTFDTGMKAWRDWQESPWGRLFYRQSEANLGRHLAARAAGAGDGVDVLDLAGGNGVDAIRLARAGHHVTVVDCSAEMLAAARIAFGDAGLADRVELVQDDAAAFVDRAADAAYDLVLCHNLIQYLSDPAATLAAVDRLLRPGGLLSVIAINRHSAPLRKALLELDPVAASAALGSTESWTPTFNTALRTYTADEVATWLEPLAHRPLGHYGIRTVSDYISDNDLKHDPDFFDGLEKLEFALADRMPYPLIARFFHLVSRKPGGLDPDGPA